MPPTSPRLEVYSAAPKGPRLSELIDGLSQVGAALWRPLDTAHATVDPRQGKLDRLERTAAESAKQCGRAWQLEIGPRASLAEALAERGTGVTPVQGKAAPDAPAVILADSTGDPYTPTRAQTIRLLIGPEGGWSPDELRAARDAGARIASFGPHIMRIETAAPVAAAIILHAESAATPSAQRGGTGVPPVPS